MSTMINPINGEPLRFSDLKYLALSPAHFRAACLAERKATRGMLIGTGTHFLLFGARGRHRVICFPGDARRGKEWTTFEEKFEGEANSDGCSVDILTVPEWVEAEAIAAAVRADPAAEILLGKGMRHEVPLQWEAGGFQCATGGVDALGCGRAVDLKITTSTEPEKWGRQAFSMLYPQQLAFYDEGCQANGIDTSQGLYIFGVESRAPYVVTVFKLTENAIELGRKSLTMWRERLRGCAMADHWPGYVQSVQSLDPPEWMNGEEIDEAEEGEAA